MRIIYDIFCKSEIKLSAITPENFAGTRGGPFDPTSVEATALELLLSLSDAHRCMAVLVPVVMKEGAPTLQLAVRMQSKLAQLSFAISQLESKS